MQSIIIDDWDFFVNAFHGQFNATLAVPDQVSEVTSIARQRVSGGVYVRVQR
jgi:hypothetical protein